METKMRCLEFLLNGKRLVMAGGPRTRSVDSLFYYFPRNGRGSFTVAGYADPLSTLSQRIFWADGDLKLGDEVVIKVVESENADSGQVKNEWGAEVSPEFSSQTCLFCGKEKTQVRHLIVGNAGAICDGCVTSAADGIDLLEKAKGEL
jgi:hypothetical protein